MSYNYSGPLGQRPSTGRDAVRRRAESALSFCPARIEAVAKTDQASASIASVAGIEVLISYNTPVAYRYPDGSAVATPRNYYSRTTDKSVDAFVGSRRVVRLDPEQFRDALAEWLRA